MGEETTHARLSSSRRCHGDCARMAGRRSRRVPNPRVTVMGQPTVMHNRALRGGGLRVSAADRGATARA